MVVWGARRVAMLTLLAALLSPRGVRSKCDNLATAASFGQQQPCDDDVPARSRCDSGDAGDVNVHACESWCDEMQDAHCRVCKCHGCG